MHVGRERANDLPDDVIVLEFFQQTNLANGGTWDTFVLCFESYFLECNDLVSCHVPRLVHDAIRSWTGGVAYYISEVAGNDEEGHTFACRVFAPHTRVVIHDWASSVVLLYAPTFSILA